MTHPRSRPWLARTAMAACAVITAAGCGAQSASPEADAPREVSVVLDWTANTNHTGLFLAVAQGYYEDEGLQVRLIEPGETSGLQLLAAGQTDFAVSVAESLVPARTEGAPVVSIAAIVQHNTSSLLSLSSSGIAGPQDLDGRVYGTYGSVLEAALVQTMARCGDEHAAVELAPLTGTDFRIGLTEGMYELVWVFDAWDTIRLRDLDGLDVATIAFLDHTDCIPDWYTPLIATSERTLAEDPELVRSFLAATARGYAEAMADPQLGADALLAAAPELDPELVRASAEYLSSRYAADPEQWGHQDAEVWERFVGFLIEHGLAPEGFDVEAAWTDVPLSESRR